MTHSSSGNIGPAVVTGGAGAIGSRLVRRLLDDGAESIIVVDDLSSGYEWLLPDDPRVVLNVRNVCDLPGSGLNAQSAVVFHLAAFFANQNSVDHPAEDLHTNGLGTLNTLRWAADTGARRVVYASAGCSIAGHGVNEPIRENMAVSLHLDTPYQITKALGEFYCNYFVEHISTVRCRFFNSYGPGEVPGAYRNVIPNFVWRALHDEPLVITGTGDETRDFIYVDDLVDGLIRSALTPEAHGQAINLGTGHQTRIIDVAQTVISACESESTIEFTARRTWDKSLHREADCSRARTLLDFGPTVPVPIGIERTVTWFRSVRDRLEPLLTPTGRMLEEATAR